MSSVRHQPLPWWNRPSPTRSPWWAAIAIFLLTGAVFARGIGYGFTAYDDYGFVVQVDGYRGLGISNLQWMFTTSVLGHYQPLTYLSYAIDYTLWGLSPNAFHFTNVLLHAANAALVFFLGLRLISLAGRGRSPISPSTLGELFGAAAGALFYALHPLRVESVTWITERRDVLSGFFLLLAALTYLRAFPMGSTRPASIASYILSIFLLLASVLSKAWGMTFFVVVLALDVYPLKRLTPWPWRWGRHDGVVILQKLPFLVIGIGAAIAAAHAQSMALDAVLTLTQWTITDRVVQSIYGLIYYVRTTAYPTNLAVLCELPPHMDPLALPNALASIVLALSAAALIAFRKRVPGLVLTAFCFIVIVSPVLGVLQSGRQLVADRYTYLAGIPLSLALGAGLLMLAQRVGPRFLFLISAAILTAISLQTVRQIGYWKTDVALFGHCIDAGWGGPLSRRLYGEHLQQAANAKLRDAQPTAAHDLSIRARDQFKIATELNPSDGDAWYKLGESERALGNANEAVAAFDLAIERSGRQPHTLLAKGVLLLDLGRAAEAVPVLREVVEGLDRRFAGAVPSTYSGRPYFMLARALYLTERPAEAREMLLQAAHHPDTRDEALRLFNLVGAENRGQK